MNNLEITINIKEYLKILDHGQDTFPEECCGVLIGNYVDDKPVISEARRMKNTNEGSKNTRYNVDPLELIKLEDQLDVAGLEMLGIYHSHPNHPAKLSETDFKFAWPNLSYAVLSVQDGNSELLTSWRLKVEGNKKIEFIPEKIIIKEN